MRSQLFLRFMADDCPMSRARKQRIVWLVRHGETTWNAMGWVQGQIDGARLTRRGRLQARQVADLWPQNRSARCTRATSTGPAGWPRSSPDGGCPGPDRSSAAGAVLRDRRRGALGEDRRWRSQGSTMAMWSTSTPGRPAANRSTTSISAVRPSSATLLERHEDGDAVVVAHGGSIRMLRCTRRRRRAQGPALGHRSQCQSSSAWTFRCPIWPVLRTR